LCVAWLSRQKQFIGYSIPLTDANLAAVELLKPVILTDVLYTNSQPYTGWINSIAYDLKNSKIDITVLFAPLQMQTVGGDGLIIERGILLNDTTVTETGTNTDTVTEKGVV
jgi:hypothetical protein